MPVDPLAKRRLGRTSIELTTLGLGCVQLGGWPRVITEEQAEAVLESAWSLGVRFFDTAPFYGFGISEERLGAFLARKPRSEFILATKVGRLIVDDPAAVNTPEADKFYKGSPPKKAVFDFSYDGVMRSFEESLQRLGLDRVDILHIHDPENHYDEALEGACRALQELRGTGTISAASVGMNETGALLRFARDAMFDCFLLAGRYTLLDQEAIEELLPLCEAKGISILIGGVFNTGVLIDPSPGTTFDYLPLNRDWRAQALSYAIRLPARHENDTFWLRRAQRIAAICVEHCVSLRAAALQFAAAHPAVASVVVGAGRPERLNDCAEMLTLEIPEGLWADLRYEGLIPAGAPAP